MHILLRAAILAVSAKTVTVANAQGNAMDRTALITSRSFSVKILANGADVSGKSPVVAVKYNADGSGSRTLRNGSTVVGSWRFTNAEQTRIEVEGPEGTSRWIVVELNEKVYRKVNVDTGVEFIHAPREP